MSARQFGHQCLGPDINIFPLFTELLELFDVPSSHFGWKFDFITAFSTAFNRFDLHDRSRCGRLTNGNFFSTILRHVNPGGLLFVLNNLTRQIWRVRRLAVFALKRRTNGNDTIRLTGR